MRESTRTGIRSEDLVCVCSVLVCVCLFCMKKGAIQINLKYQKSDLNQRCHLCSSLFHGSCKVLLRALDLSES